MALKQPLRTLLLVPGHKQRDLEKARTVNADAVILDLADSVPVSEKRTARATVRAALEEGGYGPQIILRVNGFASGMTENDLKGAFGPGVAAICLPRAAGLADTLRLAPMITEVEQIHGRETGTVSIVGMIETARGLLHAFKLAEGCQRVQALCLGGEDLVCDLGGVRTQAGKELAHARGQLILAARATAVLAIDTIWTDLNDMEGLRAEAQEAREMGYSGKLIIHPDQVAPVHEAFTPTAKEVAHAQRVVEAFDAASRRGGGVITLDGHMIHAPIVARARETLKLAGVQYSGDGTLDAKSPVTDQA
jgi:citrate lyase subunit beta/citryl-CoA lyase